MGVKAYTLLKSMLLQSHNRETRTYARFTSQVQIRQRAEHRAANIWAAKIQKKGFTVVAIRQDLPG